MLLMSLVQGRGAREGREGRCRLQLRRMSRLPQASEQKVERDHTSCVLRYILIRSIVNVSGHDTDFSTRPCHIANEERFPLVDISDKRDVEDWYPDLGFNVGPQSEVLSGSPR